MLRFTYFVRFLLYKFNRFQFILKVAGEVMNAVVRAKNAMRVKVIATPMTNVCRDWGADTTWIIVEYKLDMTGKVEMIAVTDNVSEENDVYNDIC